MHNFPSGPDLDALHLHSEILYDKDKFKEKQRRRSWDCGWAFAKAA